MDVERVVKLLRGVPGSKVTLEIARSRAAAFRLTLTRNDHPCRLCQSGAEADKIGYARITTFTENTATELASAIARMKQRRTAG